MSLTYIPANLLTWGDLKAFEIAHNGIAVFSPSNLGVVTLFHHKQTRRRFNHRQLQGLVPLGVILKMEQVSHERLRRLKEDRQSSDRVFTALHSKGADPDTPSI